LAGSRRRAGYRRCLSGRRRGAWVRYAGDGTSPVAQTPWRLPLGGPEGATTLVPSQRRPAPLRPVAGGLPALPGHGQPGSGRSSSRPAGVPGEVVEGAGPLDLDVPAIDRGVGGVRKPVAPPALGHGRRHGPVPPLVAVAPPHWGPAGATTSLSSADRSRALQTLRPSVSRVVTRGRSGTRRPRPARHRSPRPARRRSWRPPSEGAPEPGPPNR
jgi:hypothetical protein